MLLHYIDPGTGSMLFTILIGVVTAGIYGLRSAFIKLRFVFSGGRQEKVDQTDNPYVVFTDDKRYWNVFEPICDAFEGRKLPLRSLTASSDDPALAKEYEFVSCEFIGEGNKAFALLNSLRADVVLSSTPGLDVLQWKRSRDVKWYAHVFHAVSDAAMYRMFGLDYYDAVLLSGEHQRKQIRELERLRNLPAKELPIVGLSYMDSMLARYNSECGESNHLDAADGEDGASSNSKTILLAPSWGKSAILATYGGDIIDALLKTGYHVVIRPHPQSMKSEADMMRRLMADYPESDQLEWNFDNDNFNVLARSDLLISDFSGVVFDFALVFDRPIIYTEPSYDKDPYDACWLEDELWTFKVLPRIGQQLNMDDLENMKEVIDTCLSNPELQRGRNEARDECWGCRGKSAQATVDYLVAKQAELTQPAEFAEEVDEATTPANPKPATAAAAVE